MLDDPFKAALLLAEQPGDLLLALTEQPVVLEVLKACNVRVEKLREGLQEIYRLRGEDAVIARIASPLIDAARP